MRLCGLRAPARECQRLAMTPIMASPTNIQDSAYSWGRLAASLALATISGIGLWAPVVVLPALQAEFGIDRSGASVPYTATMIGFALGGVLAGRLADRFGIMI